MNNMLDVKITLPDSVDNAIENLTDKPTQTIGQVISDCLFLVFGRISQKAELKRAKYTQELREFTRDLEKKIEAIPEDERIEPNVHTVCTALDSMRYCVEEKELREMFATLIANSLDIKKCTRVHPSYGEIIRQLTSYDARLISWMKEWRNMPIITFKVADNDKYVMFPFIYMEYQEGSGEVLRVSLDNLSRLKIIDLKLEVQIDAWERYEKIKNSQRYTKEKEVVKEVIEEHKNIEDVYGSVEITQFGANFINACC